MKSEQSLSPTLTGALVGGELVFVTVGFGELVTVRTRIGGELVFVTVDLAATVWIGTAATPAVRGVTITGAVVVGSGVVVWEA